MVAALKPTSPAVLVNGYPLRWNTSPDDDRLLIVEWLDDAGKRVSFLHWQADPLLKRGGSFRAVRLTDLPDSDTLDELAAEILRFGSPQSHLRYYDFRLAFRGCAFVTIARQS